MLRVWYYLLTTGRLGITISDMAHKTTTAKFDSKDILGNQIKKGEQVEMIDGYWMQAGSESQYRAMVEQMTNEWKTYETRRMADAWSTTEDDPEVAETVARRLNQSMEQYGIIGIINDVVNVIRKS
jgi:hypothetical protein